jgi:DNA mismatch repair ATPase MutL
LPAPTPAQFVGQSGRRWLLFSSQDALIFVDRHTAFETTAIAAGGIPSQRLMIPLRIALGAPLVDALRPAIVRMQRHGLELAAATGGGVLVRAAPRSISSQQLIELVRTLAGTLLAKGAELSSAQVHARIDSHMASATAPNAGDHVPAADAAAVAAALHNVPLPPKTTADGLSVVVVPLAEIERRALL